MKKKSITTHRMTIIVNPSIKTSLKTRLNINGILKYSLSEKINILSANNPSAVLAQSPNKTCAIRAICIIVIVLDDKSSFAGILNEYFKIIAFLVWNRTRRYKNVIGSKIGINEEYIIAMNT